MHIPALLFLTVSLTVLRHASAQPVPAIPDPDRNPFWPVLLEAIEGFRNEERIYPEGEALYRSFPDSPAIRAQFAPLVLKAWAYCAVQSPVKGDAKLLAQIVRDVDAVLSLHRAGDYDAGREGLRVDRNMARFISANVNDALWMLLSSGVVLPKEKLGRWKVSVRACAEYQVKTFGKLRPYPNLDATYALQLFTAGKLLDEPTYIRRAAARVMALRGLVFAGGGMPCIDYSNDSCNYHGVVLVQLARYVQLSRDPIGVQVIRRMNPWYPLACEPNGCINQVAAPPWKTYWNCEIPLCDLELAANVVPNTAGKDLARSRGSVIRQHGGSIYRERIAVSLLAAASTWRDDQPKAEPPLPYFVRFDENTRGPRGQFGRFSWLANGRNQANKPPKLSLAGCMVLDGLNPDTPRAAALQIVSLYPNGTSPLITGDVCVSTVGDWVGAFSARHGYEDSPGVEGVQMWILTGRRAVCLLAGKAETPLDWQAWLRLGDCVAGKQPPHPGPRFESLPGSWRHGDLFVRTLHEGPDFEVAPARAFRPGPESRDLRRTLKQQRSPQLIVEAWPASVVPAKQVSCDLRDDDLYRLSVADEKESYTLVFNASGAEVELGAWRMSGGPKTLGAGKHLLIKDP